jgi:glycolate oxidase
MNSADSLVPPVRRGIFPPDPGSIRIFSIGGNVAENSGGLRGIK